MTTKKGVITAKDYAERQGLKTVKQRILQINNDLKNRNLIDTPFQDVEPIEEVEAEISFGSWIANCPDCGGAEAVDPDEPIFYCFSCGNRSINGVPRKVIFPDEDARDQIEELVMARPVNDSIGLNKIDRAFNAKPKIQVLVDDKIEVLSRSWKPVETVEVMQFQNQAITLYEKAIATMTEDQEVSIEKELTEIKPIELSTDKTSDGILKTR